MPELAVVLAENAREGDLWKPLDSRRVQCYACSHQCSVFEGHSGVCKVRYNHGGRLYVPWGYTASAQCDPIEKKPFYHVRPGSLAFSFGMLGCDLHCGYCQNWITSQALRDPAAVAPIIKTTPEALVQRAVSIGAGAIISTYNEPLITAEWAVAVFKEARAAGLLTGFVSNGNATPAVLEYLRPWVDLYKVDLKSFQDRRYRELGGRLQPVLESLRLIHRLGFWLEVVTLVVPGFNDSSQELGDIAGFLAGISPDIPWHVTAFHSDYKMDDLGFTSASSLIRAAEIGRRSGLRYVYVGNLPGNVGRNEDTACPHCGDTMICRIGFQILDSRLKEDGRCSSCSYPIPGVWSGSSH